MSEELDAHPAPQVEEDVDGEGERQQQAVETHAAAAGAPLREVLVHAGRVDQTNEGHQRDQSHHQRQGEHSGKSGPEILLSLFATGLPVTVQACLQRLSV